MIGDSNIDVIMNFFLYDNEYCIYTVKNDDEYDVCVGKIVQNNVVEIDNDRDKNIVSNIALSLVNAVK